jgi:two-component system chemotaxis response regulator CheB
MNELHPVRAFDVVAIGTSLGGIAVLRQLLSGLPAGFPASILVVQHRSARFPIHLDAYLDRVTRLAVQDARAGEPLQAGAVYIAPQNQHLTLSPDATLALSGADAPSVNYTRPAIDPLFASVAERCGRRAIGVILTGMQRDGAAGAALIKQRGGRVLVQDPRTARAPSMPQAAIATGCVDFVLPVDGLAAALTTLVMVPGAATFFPAGGTMRPLMW